MARKDEKGKAQPKGLQRFWRETIGELRKVAWPTRQEALNLTWIVLIVLIAMSIFLGLIVDSGAAWLLDYAMRLT